MEDTEICSSERKLVAVLFPGIINNEEKALECFGGIRNISQVYTNSNTRRLALSFNPLNPYVKPVHGDLHKTGGLLLKIKIKKSKHGDKINKEVKSTSVIGRVNGIYKFNAIMDFQYLPLHAEGENEKPKCCLNELLPTSPQSYDWIIQSSPTFLMPVHFTRTEKALSYRYTERRYGVRRELLAAPNIPDDKLHKRRNHRSCRAQRISFKMDEEWPTQPHQYFIERLNAKISIDPSVKEDLNKVKQAFQERPMWSKSRVQFKTKVNSVHLKLILPCVGIQIVGTSPWRLLWSRYGYDPRKDPASRIYQVLDFRIRNSAGVNEMISKREHFKKMDRVRYKPKGTQKVEPKELQEKSSIFKPDELPTQRQSFYQYCDIELEEVRELVGRLGEVPAGALCHPLRGWMPPAFDRQCRDLLFESTKNTLLHHYKEDAPHIEQGSVSDDEQDPDEDPENGDEDTGSVTEEYCKEENTL